MINFNDKSYHYVPGSNQIKVTYSNDPIDENGKHFVLWSGGCDSTLLLYELLDVYGKDKVIAISYKYPWLDYHKYESEQIHRDALKAKLKLRGENFTNFQHIEFEFNQKFLSGEYLQVESNGGHNQGIAWILSIPLYATDGSVIYTGAIKNDDLTLVTHEYNTLFENISKLLFKKIQLRGPYLHLSKSEIIEKLFTYDIYEESWYCEKPLKIRRPCYKCSPCVTHISALSALQMTSNNDFIKLKANKELDKIRNGIELNKIEKEKEENTLCSEK